MQTLVICYGTRPQVIKASRLTPALREYFRVVPVDTGQHYDHELNGLLYQQLGVDTPEHFLAVGSAPAPEQAAAVLERATAAYRTIRPDGVVVIGDTISTLGAALAAALLRLPLVHVEAGLRADAPAMLEELSRRTVDHMSTLLCAPSIRAAERLAAERVSGRVVRTGDVSYDVLRSALDAGRAAFSSLGGLVPPGPFALVTLHRAELVDDADRLRAAVEAVLSLHVPALFPVHPRTRERLQAAGLLERLATRARLIPPAGYLEMLGAIVAASVVITDSGGVQREAYWLGTPCVTIREQTEWPETVEARANTLVRPGALTEELSGAVERAVATSTRGGWSRDAYGTGDAARQITEAVRGLL
jgi:UDP-GlcNAc3NAcA epimerase